jgi:hypothetical protein
MSFLFLVSFSLENTFGSLRHTTASFLFQNPPILFMKGWWAAAEAHYLKALWNSCRPKRIIRLIFGQLQSLC